MTNHAEPPAQASSGKRIIRRFAYLLSAQGVEGLGSAAFFLYLAWVNSTMYGEVMYALAAGAIVWKVVQFGLYYPMVHELGEAKDGETAQIVRRVNIIKAFLLTVCMLFVTGLAWYRELSFQMAGTLILVSLGFGLESLSESFFADMRVRGLQKVEARIKIAGSAASYGYGVLTAALGLHPLVVAWFKLVSGLIRLAFGMAESMRNYPSTPHNGPDWVATWRVFLAATVFALIDILGIIYNKTNIFFLESQTGVDGVAVYSATWNLVDPVSVLASEQLLGWVIFPLLSALWWQNRTQVAPLVRRTAQWLMALAFPIMFLLHTESRLLIGLIYPAEFKDAIWMQQYLVWTILFSFEQNLFAYVMMVAGAQRVLLAFAACVTLLNLALNVLLVKPLGLLGGCLVIVLTKLFMTILTTGYCQVRFKYFRVRDFVFLLALAGGSVMFFCLLEPLITLHAAVTLTLGIYSLLLWKLGPRFLGRIPRKRDAGDINAEQGGSSGADLAV
ncbi:MAG: hypothetical protein HY914_15920 [Desulfomonile tiedjei]|nr:hypothetical protein [Desulfomonile tiedjei]